MDSKKIAKWSADLDGVFTMSDLKVLFGEKSEAALYKNLNALTKEKLLIKVFRGLYAVPDTSLEVISNRINPKSYISTGTILAKNAIIGSVPGRRVQAVKVGSPRVYTCELGTIEHLSIAPNLYFGFEFQNGIKYAKPEKAFLDACYFYFKGKKFSFDLDTDINYDALNPELLEQYLQKYDRRFISFYRRIWNDG